MKPYEVWRLGDAVGPLEKLVLLALLDYGAKIHPSQTTLALKCGLHRATVAACLSELRRKGLVRSRGQGKSLTYEVRSPVANGDRYLSSTATAPVANGDSTCRPGRQGSELTKEPTHLTSAPPKAAGGSGLPPIGPEERDLAADILRRSTAPRDALVRSMTAQRRMFFRDFEGYLPMAKLLACWTALLDRWARHGTSAYDQAQAILSDLDGARDRAAVVRSRLAKLTEGRAA